MDGGKKTIARKIFADMLKEMEKRGHANPKDIQACNGIN